MFTIQPYHPDDLCKILFEANDKKTPFELIHDDIFHVKYLREYLGDKGLRAKFYIAEQNYISIDYLTDYSYYYSESFQDYRTKCVRLHFFAYEGLEQKIFEAELERAVLKGNDYAGQTVDSFWNDNYLGFVVVRPIPKFLIGYTILRPYNYRNNAPNFHEKRNFWGTKEYDIHLFGCHIKINSLAFLSQDSNVAACATIAVWCMLQRAVENYYVNLKSPYEITQDAGLTVTDGNRTFPNNGLDAVSICTAITKSNLATEIIDLENQQHKITLIKKYVNAYAKIKLPIILGLSVPNQGTPARHAVAICGHRTEESVTEPIIPVVDKAKRWLIKKERFKPLFHSSLIHKLYMHDDQWGPFSRGEFVGEESMMTSWTKHAEGETALSEPITIIVTVFPQIRISYQDIEDHTISLNKFVLDISQKDIVGNISWDIQLYFTAEFKEDVRSSGLFHMDVSAEKKVFVDFLKEPMPKYVWVSTMYINGFKTMHFIYDATGLRHTGSLLFALCYYPEAQELFRQLFDKLPATINTPRAKRILETMLMDSITGFYEKFFKFKFE